MNSSALEPFLLLGAGSCLLLALVWAFRIRKRGLSAWVNLAASLLLGALFLGQYARAPSMLLFGIGLAVVCLLVVDFGVRARARAESEVNLP